MSSRAIFGLETQPCSWNWLWRLCCRPQWAQNLDKIVFWFHNAFLKPLVYFVVIQKICRLDEMVSRVIFQIAWILTRWTSLFSFTISQDIFSFFSPKIIWLWSFTKIKFNLKNISTALLEQRVRQEIARLPSQGRRKVWNSFLRRAVLNRRSFSKTGSEYFSEKIWRSDCPQFLTAQQYATSNLCRFNTHELSSNGMVRRQEERIYSGFVKILKISSIQSNRCKVHIFWVGRKFLQNLQLTFVCMYCRQK